MTGWKMTGMTGKSPSADYLCREPAPDQIPPRCFTIGEVRKNHWTWRDSNPHLFHPDSNVLSITPQALILQSALSFPLSGGDCALTPPSAAPLTLLLTLPGFVPCRLATSSEGNEKRSCQALHDWTYIALRVLPNCSRSS